MTLYLEPQLKDPDSIKDVLKEVVKSCYLKDGREVKTLIVYISSENGELPYSRFFEVVKQNILHNFVFSCSEIQRKLGVRNTNSPEVLFDKAIRKLSKHTAKGELGELILYTLLDVYFEAPKLLSKVSMKTSSNMPVFGADAIHGQFCDGKFKLYLGESKLHKSFKAASTSAASSIKSAKEKYSAEFDLLESFMDFPNIDSELEEFLLELLDPYSKTDLSDTISSPCFIGFSDTSLFSDSKSELEFISMYSDLACDCMEDYFNKIEKNSMSIDETALLLLPFANVDDLVDEFISYNGIK